MASKQRGDRGHRVRRRVRSPYTALPVGLTLGLAACSLLEPGGETWVVSTISGQPLPVTVIHASSDDGSVFELRILGGTVKFLPLARFEQRLRAQRVRNGVPADTIVPIHVDGLYVRRDSLIVVSYREPIFRRETGRLYYRVDGGGGLRGIEAIGGFGAWTYTYVRK